MEKDTTKMTIYKYDEIEVFIDEFGEPWMSQKQIAQLLGITIQSIIDILNYAYRNGELDRDSVTRLRRVSEDGKKYLVNHYGLNFILLIGFRSKSTIKALRFREWVREIVTEFFSQAKEKRIKELEETVEIQNQIITTLRTNASNSQDLLDYIHQQIVDYKLSYAEESFHVEILKDEAEKLKNKTLGQAYQRKLKGGE